MNKHAIITASAITVILIPVVFGALNIYGIEHLEYRWHAPGAFSFFTLSNHGEVEFCNTMPFWTSFHGFEAVMFYQGENLGSFAVMPLVIDPFSSAVQKGVFTSDGLPASQHVFMTLDFELDGGDIRLDPNRFIIATRTDTSIIGLIPYSASKQFDIVEFDDLMNSQDLTCS